jgi:hypothetical protein
VARGHGGGSGGNVPGVIGGAIRNIFSSTNSTFPPPPIPATVSFMAAFAWLLSQLISGGSGFIHAITLNACIFVSILGIAPLPGFGRSRLVLRFPNNKGFADSAYSTVGTYEIAQASC